MEVRKMLVLSRKENERIRIGENVVVTVVRTQGDKVRLGFEAPPDVKILREELAEGPLPNEADVRVTFGGPECGGAI